MSRNALARVHRCGQQGRFIGPQAIEQIGAQEMELFYRGVGHIPQTIASSPAFLPERVPFGCVTLPTEGRSSGPVSLPLMSGPFFLCRHHRGRRRKRGKPAPDRLLRIGKTELSRGRKQLHADSIRIRRVVLR